MKSDVKYVPYIRFPAVNLPQAFDMSALVSNMPSSDLSSPDPPDSGVSTGSHTHWRRGDADMRHELPGSPLVLKRPRSGPGVTCYLETMIMVRLQSFMWFCMFVCICYAFI